MRKHRRIFASPRKISSRGMRISPVYNSRTNRCVIISGNLDPPYAEIADCVCKVHPLFSVGRMIAPFPRKEVAWNSAAAFAAFRTRAFAQWSSVTAEFATVNETVIMKKANPLLTVHDRKKDLQLSIQLNRWILKPLGAWPKARGTLNIERYAYAMINVACVSLIGFLFVPSAMYLVLEMDDAYNILKLTGPLNFCIMAVIKYSSMIFREQDIRSGIEHIACDWTNTQHPNDRAIMVRNARFGRRLVSICAFFMYGGATFYYVALPFNNGKVTEEDGNLTYRPLMYPVARVLIDTRYTPIGEIFFLIQCLSGFIVHSIATGACSLAAAFAMHAYGRLEVLIQWIEHLVDGREDLYDNVDERLAMIVQQHVRILHFVSLTDKILREISVVEIVGCTLSMCFLGYYIVMEWESKELTSYVTYIVLYISLTFNIFILCYIGELVGEKCKEVGEVTYMIDWHRLSERRGLNLILMIAMSNTSVRLTAGNLLELSLSTFGDVVKTSVAYLNMLRTLTS
ncbi:odorant receptor 4-like isoform X2 [Cardiocondyla obscurior]